MYNAQVDFWRLVRVKTEVHVYNTQGTFRRRHSVFIAGIRLHIDLLSEAWLNWCRWRDAPVLSAATVKRQTGVVSGDYDLGGRILGTGNKALHGVVCLLFSTSRPWSLWSLPPLHSPGTTTTTEIKVTVSHPRHCAGTLHKLNQSMRWMLQCQTVGSLRINEISSRTGTQYRVHSTGYTFPWHS